MTAILLALRFGDCRGSTECCECEFFRRRCDAKCAEEPDERGEWEEEECVAAVEADEADSLRWKILSSIGGGSSYPRPPEEVVVGSLTDGNGEVEDEAILPFDLTPLYAAALGSAEAELVTRGSLINVSSPKAACVVQAS